MGDFTERERDTDTARERETETERERKRETQREGDFAQPIPPPYLGPR